MDMKRLLFSVLMVALLGACTVQENIQDGETAWKLKKYGLAADLLQKDFAKAELPNEQADIAFRIGQCYAFNNRYEKAAEWYFKAMDLGYGSEATLEYAEMLKAQENYPEAIKYFNQYLVDEPFRRPEITLELNSCNDAIAWMQRQEDEYARDTYVTNLSTLNSADADFNAVIWQNNKIIFTSNRDVALGEQKDSWTGDQFYDLFISDIKDVNSFSSPEQFKGPFNSPYNDGTVAFSNDGNEVFFTRCGSDDRKVDDYCGLYVSSYQGDNNWSEPVALPFFEDTMNIGTPCLSPDGSTLFFAATNPDGYGGADLYMSKRINDGWDAAVNIGQVINTSGNEVFPYFDKAGTFYFSSDKHPGMGGLDIFSATYKNGKFSNIKNLEYPINSGADDFGLVQLDGKQFEGSDTLAAGYFSSNRKNGKGDDDLYLYVKTKKKLPPPLYVLYGKVSRKVYEVENDVNTKVMDTIPLDRATASLYYPDQKKELALFTVSDDGMFSIFVDSSKQYKITGSKEGYFNNSTIIDINKFKGKPGDTVRVYAEVVLDLIPVATGTTTAEIRLENIYYDYDSPNLRPESFPELDKLIALLNENPGMTIQINSHTDARGKDAYNEKLSAGRAQSVVNYLVEKGIAGERLTAKGYGEKSPSIVNKDLTLPSGKIVPKGTLLEEKFINTFKANKNDFEYLHQLNRRTTFNVTGNIIINSEDAGDIRIDQAD